MRVRILGRYWTCSFTPLRRQRFDGHYVDGLTDATARTIQIESRLKGQRELEAIIHEFIHACDQCCDASVPFIHSEEYVTAQANDLTRLLWRLGYRRHGNTDSRADNS